MAAALAERGMGLTPKEEEIYGHLRFRGGSAARIASEVDVLGLDKTDTEFRRALKGLTEKGILVGRPLRNYIHGGDDDVAIFYIVHPDYRYDVRQSP